MKASSILGPAEASGYATSHKGWENRRSRPLPEYLPLSIETQKRVLQGLFIARMTGQAEVNSTNADSMRVRLADGRWMEVSLTGLRLPHPRIPMRDYPGRLFEGLIPAMVEAHRRSSLDLLLPYQRLQSRPPTLPELSPNWTRMVVGPEGAILPGGADAPGQDVEDARLHVALALGGVMAGTPVDTAPHPVVPHRPGHHTVLNPDA